MKVTLKADGGNIDACQYGEAYHPDGRDIPPCSEALLQDDESASLLSELLDIAAIQQHKKASEDLKTQNDYTGIVLRE